MEHVMKPDPGAGAPVAATASLTGPSLPEPEKLSVMRVNQLDAGVLDSELHGLLKTQLGRACSGLPAGTLERFRPEVDALFNLLMFRFTIWMQRPTPGMHLEGLRYRNEASHIARTGTSDNSSSFRGASGAATGGGGGGGAGRGGVTPPNPGTGSPWPLLPSVADAPTRSQRLLHGLLSVGVQWGFARLRRHGLMHGWGRGEAGSARRVIWHVMRRLEMLFRVAWMANLLLFLRHGKYATPVDRIVQMRMVHERTDPAPRPINYQFLNRRLLWDHWVKMAYVVTPLINWNSIRRAVSGGAARLRREALALGVIGGGAASGVSSGRRGRRSLVSPLSTRDRGEGPVADGRGAAVVTACAECGADPAKTPYVTECGHVFCYYCARTACTVDPRYACPLCGEYFASSRRWSQPR